jgi:superfamily II DNA or RNA helicase
VLVVPTGGGKTSIAVHIIQKTVETVAAQRPVKTAPPNTVLFLAHRKELVEQCSERLTQFGLDNHGIMMASHPRRRPFAPIQVGSIATVARRRPLDPAPRVIFADECHRSVSAGYGKVLDLYPDAIVIGLTATPWRLDGRGLGELYDELVIGATYQELLTHPDGPFLVRPRVFCPMSERLDLDAVKLTGGDYRLDELGEKMTEGHRIGDIVDWWGKLARGRRTVAFTTTVAHSRALMDAFAGAGVRAGHIDGNTDWDERKGTLQKLKSGALDVVCNCAVLTEGWDCPETEVGILARPTKSLALYMQQVGRVLRPAPWINKQEALVLDHAGCVLDHGWPTEDREWTLDDWKDMEGGPKKAPSAKICPTCFLALPAQQRTCPSCGHVFGDSGDEQDTSAVGTPMVELGAPVVQQSLQLEAPKNWEPDRARYSRDGAEERQRRRVRSGKFRTTAFDSGRWKDR